MRSRLFNIGIKITMNNSIRKNFTQASINLSGWWFIVLEILIVSIAIATYFDSIYIFPLSAFILLALFYNHSCAIYTSTFFALFWALFPSMIISIFLGLNFIQSIPELLSSAASKVLALTIFLIVFYYHITASDFINDLLAPVIKKMRFKIPFHIRNEKFLLNISGSDLEKREVKKYVENILFRLMPFHEKEAVINIEEVNKIKFNEAGHKYVLGTCSYDYKDTINIKIAKKWNGKKIGIDQKMVTLAHEIIHCKQFLKGELHGSNWNGRDYENIEYERRPWEIEANYYQDKMFKKYWHS